MPQIGRAATRLRHPLVAAGAALVLVAALGPGASAQATATSASSAAVTSAGSSGTSAATGNAAPSTNVPVPPEHPVKSVCGQSVPAGQAACTALERTDVTPHEGLYTAQTAASAPAGYGPDSLRSAYHLPSLTAGIGTTVAVVDAYDDPNAESDLAVYRQQYGLPACTSATGCFTQVAQDGSTNYPPPDAQWSAEISLDLDMVSAICPYCHILLVEADDNTLENLGAAVNEAVALGAKYISNSYAGTEVPWQTTFDQDYNHPGVVITASSGDSGYGAEYPASSPYVTAVGGTTLVRDTGVPRGWAETAWSGAGSGCSAYESKPAWQKDTGCANRTVADVSADADPDTGVAVYDTWGSNGWGVFGGTSVAAPLIASVYALAGTPAAGSYPASYPYAAASALNDVTTGGSGGCSKSELYLCTAEPGYDGPTGLGTPDGVSAFEAGPHGIVSGTLTDAATGKPLADAEVKVGSAGRASTSSSGQFATSVPPGSYTVTARAFGYTTDTVTGVQVTADHVTTERLRLQPLPSVTVTGTVTDGSGEGWPLYAAVSVSGTSAVSYTNPATGQYSLALPDNGRYTLDVDPVYSGYQDVTQAVQTGTSGLTENVSVPVDATACTAPGYGYQYDGTTQTFDASTTPAGWTVVDNNADGGWEFDDPGGLANDTGGSGNFAVATAAYRGPLNTQLVSPVTDLSADAAPVLQFDSDLMTTYGDTAEIDLSVDGGQTWTNIWEYQSYPGIPGPDTVVIPLPSAAGQSQVQVRFDYTSYFGWWWELDNVYLGDRSCGPNPGGLVAGQVIDGNTGAGVSGATVTGSSAGGVTATTAPAPAGSAENGFYYVFTQAGTQTLTASMLNYTSATGQASVTAGATTIANLTLQAGQLSVKPAPVSVSEPLGRTTTRTLQLTDTGQEPVDVRLYQQPGSYTTPATSGSDASGESDATGSSAQPATVPLHKVSGHFTPLSRKFGAKPAASSARQAATGTAVPSASTGSPSAGTAGTASTASTAGTADAWTSITGPPTAIMDNAVATDPSTGLVYSVGGLGNGLAVTSAGYVYDPATQQWSSIPNLPQPLEAPQAAFIDGLLYVVGGWDSTGEPVTGLEIYNPQSQTWSSGADIPAGYAGAGVAVLNGEIYVVGGCDAAFCGYSNVQVYDPATDTWTQAAQYPIPVSWEACGALSDTVYCAGGITNSADGTDTNAAYSYSPVTGQWSPIQGLPIDLWGMSYATANGKLLVSGGVTNGEQTTTNQGFAYDPSTGAWSALPNSVNTDYRAGGGCGFYRIGGATSGENYQNWAEELPGYDSCSGTSVPWLSQSQDSVTLSPGQSVTVTLTLSATGPAVPQPGTYTANLVISQNTPYTVAPVAVSLSATVPPGWGEIAGTVTGLSCHGGTPAPLPGATVEIYGSGGSRWLVKTGSDGSYSLWLPADPAGRLTVIAALDGWQPQVKYPAVVSGRLSTAGFALSGDSSCGG